MSQEPGKPTTVMPERGRPGLFECVGVEIEYMIVDAGSLDVRPICDQLIADVAGEPASEIELGTIAWSNELTLHVLELKTNGPAPDFTGLSGAFHRNVQVANQHLATMGARLMPGAMHPWMDPGTETRLWPHEYTEVYRTFDRIFGCSGHGWSNLQSTHLNLPFRTDEEFARLHAAIRVVLPLIPALSAASPFQDGRRGPSLDGRMTAYRGNARRVPSVSGRIVPEQAFSQEEYETEILGRIYRDLAPLDPEGTLRHEWANARGAIARFDRGAIEIRVIDAQECPAADLAVLAAVAQVVQTLTEDHLAQRDIGRDPSTEVLAAVLDDAILAGDQAMVAQPDLLRVLGLSPDAVSLGTVWKHLLDASPPADLDTDVSMALQTIVEAGPLGRRLLQASGPDPVKSDLRDVADALCDCLSENRMFTVGSP